VVVLKRFLCRINRTDQGREVGPGIVTVSSRTVDPRQTVGMVALGIGENADAPGVLGVVFD